MKAAWFQGFIGDDAAQHGYDGSDHILNRCSSLVVVQTRLDRLTQQASRICSALAIGPWAGAL